MAEFKLICPGCSAEYALPEDAIPPAGREVECSSCGHVWQAYPPAPDHPLDLGSFVRPRTEVQDDFARPLPPVRQRLSADVLDILQDEVEFERSQREAQQHVEVHPTTDDIDWPATTVVLPSEGPLDRPAKPPAAPRSPTVIRHAPPRTEPQPVPQSEPRRVPEPAPQPVPEPVRHIAAPIQADKKRYALGFSLAMLIAAGVAAVYVLAPILATRGMPLSDQLMAWRDGLDGLRLWLEATVRGT